ncbi:hypothetical protein ACP4OV_031767 [Aristida adscensionis]
MEMFQTLPVNPRSWADVREIVPEAAGRTVLVRGWAQALRRVNKLYCISRSENQLPFNFEDAARTCEESSKDSQTVKKLARVSLDTRLNNRAFDLRTPVNQAIFKLQNEVDSTFRRILLARGFLGIHTPKLTAGISEGGSAVFSLSYLNGQAASLAQSPQLYKQMAINGGLKRVFEVGTVFRAEKSNTHRHLCEYIGIHVELEIQEHYFEICDLCGSLFVKLFDHLSENCGEELKVINEQYPSEPLKYLKETLKLKCSDGIEMLKASGFAINYLDDLNSQAEKRLGQIVRERFHTDFYILYEYPLEVRPFYTVPCVENRQYSNSFDAFIRGEEVVSGSQRIHHHDKLVRRIEECGIDPSTLKGFTDSFRYGAPPRGGFGAGLERVVMLYCGLPDIRNASLFPRDPHRLEP